jgi:molybdopterin-containing oxidoreductase family membrane subunit
MAVMVLAALAVLGVIGVIVRLAGGTGPEDQKEWGYVAATVSVLLTAFGGAPLVAIAPSLAKANWVRPVTRIAALFTVGGIVTTLLLIPLLAVLPPLVVPDAAGELARRRSVWFDAPQYSPHFWAIIGLAGLTITGLGLLWANSLPDLAAMRDHATGWRQRWGKKLARGFVGTENQWRSVRMRIGMLGTLYFLLLIFVHFLISTDFNMSLVPGWRDAIFPMYHALTGLQSGVASVLIAMYIARRWGGMEKYLGRDQFWALGKLLFALSLLWFYFFYSGFIVFWYGRAATDKMVLDLLIRGPFIYAFIAAFVLSFFLPWWLLIWNRVRASVTGPAFVAVIILAGLVFDRIRIYAATWSVDPARIHERVLTVIPDTRFPDIFDIFVMVGAPAAAVLAVLLATRVVPVVSIWETKQWMLLSSFIKYHRGHAMVVAKPD